ncbi:hypothetical protein [Candidatus Magnetaquicoccus inordinatus]|uniref:hypothetical protein n=1 Tax=Candidatus Magnetaquicoccus inordinatus TaxID=2496818 RepID=UPI00102C3A71|nr:hypothetical protein [Candidatus Magnetaquicoccus inordinatus]
MKQLGELLLPDSLQWQDRYLYAPVHQTMAHTLAGRPVYFVSALLWAQPITLLAEESVTWLDGPTVAALAAMAAQAGATFPLLWEEDSFRVLFRHQDAPALQLRPLWPNHDHYIGTIKLIVC